MSEWEGWAIVEEGRGIVYIRQDHNLPEIGEFNAYTELRERQQMGHKVNVTRVKIIPIPWEKRS